MLRPLPLLYAALLFAVLRFRRTMLLFAIFEHTHLHRDAGTMNRNEEKTSQYVHNVDVHLFIHPTFIQSNYFQNIRFNDLMVFCRYWFYFIIFLTN